MQVYILIDVQDLGDTQKILAVFKHKKHAEIMCSESDLNPNHAIKEFMLIE